MFATPNARGPVTRATLGMALALAAIGSIGFGSGIAGAAPRQRAPAGQHVVLLGTLNQGQEIRSHASERGRVGMVPTIPNQSIRRSKRFGSSRPTTSCWHVRSTSFCCLAIHARSVRETAAI